MVYCDGTVLFFYTCWKKVLKTYKMSFNRRFLTLLALVLFASGLSAQKQLNGLWEGVMTRNSLESTVGYRFELYLKTEGTTITGRSYLYLEDGEIIEMELSGYVYQDRSVYIQEVKWVKREGQKIEPPFLRKFQLVYERSIWENKLEGYWQEKKSGEVLRSKEYGRILLKRYIPDKA